MHIDPITGLEQTPREPREIRVTDDHLRECLEQYMGGMLVLSEIIYNICKYDHERDKRVSY